MRRSPSRGLGVGLCRRAVAGGPYALQGLVAGWALATGPQQTLAQSGVVNGGPADLTDAYASAGYGPDGFIIASGGDAILQLEDGGGSLVGAQKDTSYLWAFRFLVSGDGVVGSGSVDITGTASTFGNPYGLYLRATPASSNDPGTQLDLQEDSGPIATTQPATVDYPVVGGIPHIGFGYYDSGAGALSIRIDPGDWVTITISDQLGPDWTLTQGDTLLVLRLVTVTAPAPPYLGQVRLWRGPHAATLAADATFRSWLANAGAGRTDAELAAYTP